METEIEAKFPNINKDNLREKLKEIGAVLEYEEVLMRRSNFDYPDRTLDKKGGWIRVRDEGNKVTLSYKQLNDRTLHGTKEVSLVVDNFEKSCEFLLAVGFEIKAQQETKREKWTHRGVEITIDTWPWVPSFVELESKNESTLKEISSLLGFNWADAMHGSVETIYQMHYDFSESEIDHWESITFIPEPEWLLARKK
jgi:adenylate cyclase class 2